MGLDKGRGRSSSNVINLAIPHFREPCKVLPDVSTLQKEQKAQLKKHLTQGPIRTVADPPKAQLHVENLTTGTGVLSECLWSGREPEFDWQMHE